MAAGENPSEPTDTLASLRRRSRRVAVQSRPVQADLFAAPEPAKAALPGRIAVRAAGVRAISAPPAASLAPPAPERHVWSVRALVSDVRFRTESAYGDIWVEGEISGCRPAASGHVYFTLKDGEAQLPVVLFRRQAQLLRFRPADGLAVLVRGRLSVYESRGQLQLIAETMEPRGAGALQLAYEQLKRRLAEEGLFDAARKRPLPAFPHCIGVVTSPTGAVIRDIVTVIRRRHARLNLLVYPAVMQGAGSPASVIAGIRWFNAAENRGRAEVILIARGGGSLEDLAAFNDEALARAIAASVLPVVSAIGHETDFTIADFAADLRAATPSAAAELITSAQHRIEERIATLGVRLERAIGYRVMQARQRYTRMSADAVLARLRDGLHRREQRIDDLGYRMESAMQRRLRAPAARLSLLSARLREQAPTARLAAAHRRLARAHDALGRIGTGLMTARRTRLAKAATRLEALSPLAVLNRGYALVYAENGGLLRSAAETQPGLRIRARLAAGTLTATVLETESETQSE
jgi:exodeoxyribonuclease VII large subunit